MIWQKVIEHGAKAFLFVVLASIITVLASSLTLALGYKPGGAVDPIIWEGFIKPLILALIVALTAASDNIRKHIGKK